MTTRRLSRKRLAEAQRVDAARGGYRLGIVILTGRREEIRSEKRE